MPIDSHRCSEDGRACPHRAGGACLSSDDVEPSAVQGGALAWSAVAMFLLPVLLAIALATAAGPGRGAQLLGALAGLGIGMAGSVLLARRIGKHRGKDA